MSRQRYKHTILLLLVLIIPCVAILLLGWRDFNRERERRMTDAQEHKKESVRLELVQTLARIKLQETDALLNSSIVLVASVEGNRLLMPWDADTDAERFRTPLEEPRFVQAILRARRFERSDKNYEVASSLYRELVVATNSENQRVYAQFLLAGALDRAGKKTEAFRIHRDLLKLPNSAVDEYGAPLAYFVAFRMANGKHPPDEVLDRVATDLEARVIPPGSVQIIREILQRFEKSEINAVAERATDLLSKLEVYEKHLNKAAAFQKDFQTLHLTPTTWQLYGQPDDGVWLVSIASYNAASLTEVVAVDAASIFKTIESASEVAHPGPSFEITMEGDGEPLSADLPGIRVRFHPQARTGLWTTITRDQPVYALLVSSVVILTLLGGYLLWRDTQREIHLAALRTQFVSSVSHELKTPLTAIRMFAEIMQMQGPGDPQKHAEHLETIVSETERLTRLLNNVLDFSKIERGEKNYNAQPSSMLEVVNAAVRTMRFPLAERGFNFKVNIAEGVPAARVDRDAIEQAILNLLSNAMKYSGESRDIELRLFVQDGKVVIQVADHGIGIPAEEQKRIFERFYRVPTSENRAISGTGLGLALVAHIAEAHHGSVEVESCPGKGSTFSIWLPVDAESFS